MSAPCEICGDLRVKRPWTRLQKDLQVSSLEDCKGCSLLFRALDLALREWHEGYTTDPLLKDAIEVSCQQYSSRNVFVLDVIKIESEEASRHLLKLQLHAAPDTEGEFADIGQAGLVVPDSGSDESVDKIRKWLQVCKSDHPKCNSIRTEWSQRVPIPAKRVIDVGNDLVPPCLLEEGVVRGYYTCLSHCWGNSKLLTTTIDTLAARKACISLDTLPKTFRDAIMLTRKLGIKYIWIDSLCIVQDDVREWKQEASRMFEIYGHAYLTIAATAAHDSTEGLFSTRGSSLPIPGTNVYLRQKLDHSAFRKATSSPEDVSASTYPLFTRGWCLQERLLSNRILHFTSTEMVWQCRSSDMCECDGIQLLASNNISSSRLLTSRLKYNRVVEGASGSDIWTIWREIVEEYCSTSLTHDSDLLPALSGVAAKFGLAGAGTYMAGLWHKPGALSLGSSPLFLDLLWKSSGESRRPSVKVAPSFSWASRMGPISYRNEARDGATNRYQSDARDGKRRYIHKVIFVTKLIHGYDDPGVDRYSAAPDAEVKLRAQLIPCTINIAAHMAVYQVVIDVQEFAFIPDVAHAIRPETDAQLALMPVALYEHYKKESNVFDGILLAHVEGGRYRRVGLVEQLPEDLLSRTGHKEVTLT